MPASQATGLPGLADKPLVCSLGDELVVTLAHHFVGDIGMHDVLLTVCSALDCKPHHVDAFAHPCPPLIAPRNRPRRRRRASRAAQ